MSKSLMAYQGSKRSLAKLIKPYFPKHNTYIEVFVGSGGMLLNKDISNNEVINDFNSDLTNLFEVIRNSKDEMISKMRWLIISRELFYKFNRETIIDPIERAIATIYTYTYSFNGTGIIGGFGTKVNKSIDDIISNIEMVHKRLKNVVIENRSFERIFEAYKNKPETFMYLDPPYLDTGTKAYGDKNIDHELLIKLVQESSHKIIISHLDNELYNNAGFFKQGIINKIDGIGKSQMNKEVIYSNFNLIKERKLF